jgi:hypothetical protein
LAVAAMAEADWAAVAAGLAEVAMAAEAMAGADWAAVVGEEAPGLVAAGWAAEDLAEET